MSISHIKITLRVLLVLFFLVAVAIVFVPKRAFLSNGDGKQRSESVKATREIPITQPDNSNGQIQVLVELKDEPATVIYARVLKESQANQRQATAAARTQLNVVRREQNNLSKVLFGNRFGAKEIYRVQKALNGIALSVDVNKLDSLRKLDGVKQVHFLQLEYPITSSSVAFLGVNNLWGNTLSLPNAYTGTGIKIGIIDTGIDYQHANFGGTGLLTDYQANDRTDAPDAYYPNTKVVGGYDLAGDTYNGSNAPTPDSDPMDCNGHGTHVAGIAAGFGVNSDGTTYNGLFDLSTPFSSLRIGPGTAPQASIYAYRVFGCGGGTNLTVQAIDMAIDPNNDDDFSDRMDVINMSLGSDYGTLSNASTIASDNAVLVGTIVVTSAGNSGDTHFIAGSPGNAGRVISVAASIDTGVTAFSMKVNSPAGIAGFYTNGIANTYGGTPPVGGLTGNVVQALDPSDAAGTLTTDGCSALTNAASVAGNIAFIDRGGTCAFSQKARNAQDAGAIGVIMANNASAFGNLGGVDPTVTIPMIIVTQTDGNTFRTNLASGLNVTLLNGADTMSSFSSRGPRIGGALKPDIAAPGYNITSSQTGVTCTGTSSTGCQVSNSTGFIPDSQTLTISGTSMSAPHIAGIMALLRQEHPDWTVEELKALAMNTANNDVTQYGGGNGATYGTAREGAGRVDASKAATTNVVAFNSEDAGLVSISFETDVVGTATEQKKIRIVNKGTSDQIYDLAFNTTVDAPGVSFSLPDGNSVVVPAGQSVEIPVQLDADASQMDHTREATVSATQTAPGSLSGLGNLERHWLTEETGFVTLSQSGSLKLRVPFYTALRPASNMSAPATITTGGAPTGSTTIPLSGADVCTGTLSAGPTCTGASPTDEVSLVTPFELQVVNPRSTSINAAANIKYVGVSYDSVNNIIVFGVASHGDWSTPSEAVYNIYIDTDSNGTYERILFGADAGNMNKLFGASSGQDTFITGVLNISTSGVSLPSGTARYMNRIGGNTKDTALLKNNVMFFGATPANLGLAAATTPFKYKVVTCPNFNPLCLQLNGYALDQVAGPFSYSTATQGLNFGNTFLASDLNGASIPVTWDTANMSANGSKGALLLHHHNGKGTRAEVVALEGTQTSDTGVTVSASNTTPTLGSNITLTVTATNNGADDAASVQVTDLLPNGLIYVSDDGGGNYNTTSGLWNVGALSNGASKTLNITVTVNTTDIVTNNASISFTDLVDTNPANDSASVTINAPRSADLNVSISADRPTANQGENVTYMVTVQNTGNDPAYSINLSEAFVCMPPVIPSGYTVSHGVFNPATGVWKIASLGKNATASLNFTVAMPGVSGNVVNEVNVTSSVSDPVSINNIASATVLVVSDSKQVVDFDGDGKSDLAVIQTALSPSRELNNKILLGGDILARERQKIWSHDYQKLLMLRSGRGFVAFPKDVQQAQTSVKKTSIRNLFAMQAIEDMGGYTWMIRQSNDGSTLIYNLGNAGDVFVPADYDGDGKWDPAVWTPSTATFTIINTSTQTPVTYSLGNRASDPTVVGDYDGDGNADPAVYNKSTGLWSYLGGANHTDLVTQTWVPGGIPAPGDYNGDGKYDFAIQLPPNSAPDTAKFRIAFNDGSVGPASDIAVSWGLASYAILPGDYDGDGKCDIAQANLTGTDIGWRVLTSSSNYVVQVKTKFGLSATDRTVQGDYDGDGKTDYAVFRATSSPDDGVFKILQSSNAAIVTIDWGNINDNPVGFFNTH